MILPSPSRAFTWVETDSGPALVCQPLEPFAPHLFTTCAWPLGATGQLDRERAWGDVAQALNVDIRRLVRVRQVHGADVLVARPGADLRAGADIIVTNESDAALAVRVADCVPLLVADRRTGAIAAAHAGWRGLCARVPEATVAALVREFGSRSEDLVAAAGPSIGACCYEVGPDVRASFERSGFAMSDLERWFLVAPTPTAANPSMPALRRSDRMGHWFFDGWAATRDQLAGAGVPAAQIFIAETCTASHPQVFCSYRRDGAVAGRLAGAIKRAAPPHP